MLTHAYGSPTYLHLILYSPCHRAHLPTSPLNLFPLVTVSPCPRVPSTLFSLTSWGAFFASIAAELNLIPAPGPFLAPEERPLTSWTDLRRQVFFFYATHIFSINKIPSFANRPSQQKGVRLRRRSLTPVTHLPSFAFVSPRVPVSPCPRVPSTRSCLTLFLCGRDFYAVQVFEVEVAALDVEPEITGERLVVVLTPDREALVHTYRHAHV